MVGAIISDGKSQLQSPHLVLASLFVCHSVPVVLEVAKQVAPATSCS